MRTTAGCLRIEAFIIIPFSATRDHSAKRSQLRPGAAQWPIERRAFASSRPSRASSALPASPSQPNREERHHSGGLITCELGLAQDAKTDFECHLKLRNLAVVDEPTSLRNLVPRQAFQTLRRLCDSTTDRILRGGL